MNRKSRRRANALRTEVLGTNVIELDMTPDLREALERNDKPLQVRGMSLMPLRQVDDPDAKTLTATRGHITAGKGGIAVLTVDAWAPEPGDCVIGLRLDLDASPEIIDAYDILGNVSKLKVVELETDGRPDWLKPVTEGEFDFGDLDHVRACVIDGRVFAEVAPGVTLQFASLLLWAENARETWRQKAQERRQSKSATASKQEEGA